MPFQKILIATHNSNKVSEIRSIMGNLSIQIISANELNIPDVEETGKTFVENAILKARHAANLSKLPTIADDSGLCVDALMGAPGIYSARYAGEGASNEKRLEKLLAELKEVPKDKRGARFCCCAVFMRHAEDPLPLITQGFLEGQILFEPQGQNGFGYDPLLYLPSRQCSVAELEPGVKNQMSHRANAFIALIKQLKSLS